MANNKRNGMIRINLYHSLSNVHHSKPFLSILITLADNFDSNLDLTISKTTPYSLPSAGSDCDVSFSCGTNIDYNVHRIIHQLLLRSLCDRQLRTIAAIRSTDDEEQEDRDVKREMIELEEMDRCDDSESDEEEIYHNHTINVRNERDFLAAMKNIRTRRAHKRRWSLKRFLLRFATSE